jgi:hypothetical protein
LIRWHCHNVDRAQRFLTLKRRLHALRNHCIRLYHGQLAADAYSASQPETAVAAASIGLQHLPGLDDSGQHLGESNGFGRQNLAVCSNTCRLRRSSYRFVALV